ncbi:uncharacterized protein [Triticum aestivum]|uniref:uncharacterized protein n=1 Tax=Triticum aestivum TaxID=4565 RepID=UPI001D021D91|nr:uncharacterized protein LOC123095012 [Triticum aestivum]
MTIRDRDHDILAGRYLDGDEQIHAGACFTIDYFHFTVRDCVQESLLEEEPIECVDLTSDSESKVPKPVIGGEIALSMRARATGATGATGAAPAPLAPIVAAQPLAPGARQVGGRFWVLAGSAEGEEDEGDDAGDSTDEYSPTASDVICEAFRPGYSEEEVASIVPGIVTIDDPARQGLLPEENIEVVRRIVHRRTANSAIRPWKGPMPKVIFRATALIRSWSPLTTMEAREHLVTACIRWETVTRDIFNRFGWRSCNRIGN